jgi:hypothetical protein
MRFISSFAALCAGTFATSVAMAADPPNLVGTWKATGEAYASVRLGEANEHHPKYSDPNYGIPDHAWTIVFEEQKGRAFHGVSKSPKGHEEEFVGVVSFDGQRLLLAVAEGGIFAELLGDKMEWCYQDHQENRASVSCFIVAKE